MTDVTSQGHDRGLDAETSHVESESSQIVNFITGNATLPNALAPIQGNMRISPGASKGHIDASGNDDSFAPVADGSASGSTAGSASHYYHFHGLATTQTQSQHVEEPCREDSQKENTPAPNNHWAAAHPAYGYGYESGNKTAGNQSSEAQSIKGIPPSPLENLATVALSSRELLPPFPSNKGTKTVSFLSPVRHHTPPIQKALSSPSMRLRRRRSASPASQDSFAGPSALQDPDLYVALAPQFDKPLEELGQSNSQEPSTPYSGTSRASTRHQAVSASEAARGHSAPQMSRYNRSSNSEPVGKVLVENSDESSGQSQESDGQSDSQDFIQPHQSEEFYEPVAFSQQSTEVIDASQDSQHSTEHSTSQLSNSSHASIELLVPTQMEPTQLEATQLVPTQILRPEPTQILEPTQIVNESTQPDLEVGSPSSSPAYQGPSDHQKSTEYTSITPSSRGLWTMTAPNKQAHYERIHQAALQSQSPRALYQTHTSNEESKDEAGRSHGASALSHDTRPDDKACDTTDVVPDSEVQSNERSNDSGRVQKTAEWEGEGKCPAEEVIPASEPDRDSFSSDVTMKDRKEEETDNDDDDVPLAKVVAVAKADKNSKGKGKEIDQATPLATAHVGVVPSAVSPQSPTTLPRSRQQKRQYGKSKVSNKSSAGKAGASRSLKGPATRTTRSRSKRNVTKVEEDENDNPPDVPTVRMEDDVETVLAEDDNGEADESEVDEPHKSAPSSKRKRTTPARAKKSVLKIASRSIRQASTVSSGPPSKRLCVEATRVFAWWQKDNSYYAGTIQSVDIECETKFLVLFDDGDDAVVDISKMRSCTLRVGDRVCVKSNKRKATVVRMDGWERRRKAVVVPGDGQDNEEIEVDSTQLRIPAKILQYEWTDRLINLQDVVVANNALKSAPSSSSNLSASGARNKVLAKMAFVITLKPGIEAWEVEKKDIVKSIKDLGGVVLKDWNEVFCFQGTYLNSKQWVILKEDVNFMKIGVDRVFLLADEPNQKSKYLIALGLGIPCVSIQWPKVCAHLSEEATWQSYLLPAGFSEHLDTRISQTIDFDWCKSLYDLEEIMDSHVPHKLMLDKSILCLGAEMLPIEHSEDASRMVPHIILCMGASRVEAVTDRNHASMALTDYDYVVVYNTTTPLKRKGVTCVDVPWIKACLISGKLLPIPQYG